MSEDASKRLQADALLAYWESKKDLARHRVILSEFARDFRAVAAWLDADPNQYASYDPAILTQETVNEAVAEFQLAASRTSDLRDEVLSIGVALSKED